MSKISIILLYFVFNYLIDLTKTTELNPKNILFSSELNTDEELIYDSPNDYIKVSVAKDKVISGRSGFPLCFAVGCTKTALICEEKKGKMITTFRSVNDTRQAFFRSTLVAEDMVLTVNCRESHISCCFEGNIKKKPTPLRPPPRPTAPITKIPAPVRQAPAPLGSSAQAVSLPNPLGPISSIQPHPQQFHTQGVQTPQFTPFPNPVGAISSISHPPNPQQTQGPQRIQTSPLNQFAVNGGPLPTILITPFRPNFN